MWLCVALEMVNYDTLDIVHSYTSIHEKKTVYTFGSNDKE